MYIRWSSELFVLSHRETSFFITFQLVASQPFQKYVFCLENLFFGEIVIIIKKDIFHE